VKREFGGTKQETDSPKHKPKAYFLWKANTGISGLPMLTRPSLTKARLLTQPKGKGSPKTECFAYSPEKKERDIH